MSEHSINLDEEEKRLVYDAGRGNFDSHWNKCKREIHKRKSTRWIERFAAGLTEEHIRPTVLEYIDARKIRMEATGWKNEIVNIPPVPVAPLPTSITGNLFMLEMLEVSSFGSRSY